MNQTLAFTNIHCHPADDARSVKANTVQDRFARQRREDYNVEKINFITFILNVQLKLNVYFISD